MLLKILAIGAGAAGGAWIRWGLGLAFNATLKNIPLGTLLANLVGGFLIGAAIEFFSHNIQLSPEWKLLVITGFLGGLTTFSTFSLESVQLLQSGRLGWAAFLIGVHVFGSIVMTIVGLSVCKSMLT
ncbi:MAG: fluoride efflux transporter CrcB [Burkholderiales bacterium]|nr:fluoride efflux transporter CrcB [Burkholderiales bacterium]